MSFERMNRRSLRRGVSHASQQNSIDVAGMRARGNLNHVTMMVAVPANSHAFKPVIVFPGKLPHYRCISSGTIQIVHEFLPPSYIYHRNPAGVEKTIFMA